MKETISIGIAEDHGLVRQGLILLLRPHKHINVLFDVANGKELLERLKTDRPQILLLDIEMPVMRGQEVIERIRKKYPKIKVIIVSAHFQKEYIVECFRLGVKAFLPKDDKIERVLEAITSVHERGVYSDDTVTLALAGEIQDVNKKMTNKNALSIKEIDALKLICSGLSAKKAAETLHVKVETVNFHLGNIRRKTGIRSTPELVSYAIQNKII